MRILISPHDDKCAYFYRKFLIDFRITREVFFVYNLCMISGADNNLVIQANIQNGFFCAVFVNQWKDP